MLRPTWGVISCSIWENIIAFKYTLVVSLISESWIFHKVYLSVLPITCTSWSRVWDRRRRWRRACRRAERGWKKDRLHVSFDILCRSRTAYQKSVQMAKAAFLSDIIVANGHNPRVLFKIFNSVVNPRSDVLREASTGLCERFLNYFTDKIASLKALHLPAVSQVPTLRCSSAFYQFEPIYS